MRVYIAGPMRGHVDENRAAFDDAERRWREDGHEVYSPAAIDRATGSSCLRHIIGMDLICVERAEAIALLPGWEGSLGATLELAYAQFLEHKVYCAISKELINPRRCPWSLPSLGG
jgi:hypothetical protein